MTEFHLTNTKNNTDKAVNKVQFADADTLESALFPAQQNSGPTFITVDSDFTSYYLLAKENLTNVELFIHSCAISPSYLSTAE